MACHLTSKDHKIKVYLFAQVCQISVSPLCCNAIQIALNNYLKMRNESPKRYVWKKKGEDILRKINKARKMLGWDEYNVPI